jgi:peptide-methionine (R)-S-oxide reductase
VTDVEKSDEEWRRDLTPAQYEVLRHKGTERPFTGELLEEKRRGVFRCAGCGAEVFGSEAKYESGTGWPSFYEPMDEGNVELEDDRTYGMVRTEVMCKTCGGHLGHVFDDGPAPTGQRYCLNSVALDFEER